MSSCEAIRSGEFSIAIKAPWASGSYCLNRLES